MVENQWGLPVFSPVEDNVEDSHTAIDMSPQPLKAGISIDADPIDHRSIPCEQILNTYLAFEKKHGLFLSFS